MTNHSSKGWRRIIYAFGYSMKGFKACYEFEEAFRQEVFVLMVMIPLALLLGQSPVERALLVGSLLLVPIVELLNSAIETNVDRVGLERNELSARAKDIASAAVFMSISFAATTWGLLLIPRWL